MTPTITHLTPKEFEKILTKERLITNYYQTAAGTLQVYYCSLGLCRAYFVDTIEKDIPFSTTLDLNKIVLVGTQFQCKVWQSLLSIPEGTVTTYNNLAISLGYPKAYRAVANALGDNKIAYFIPCHRVLRKDGSLGGYSSGIERKKALLKAEGIKLTYL